MKIFNKDLKETIFSQDFIKWWKDHRFNIFITGIGTIGVASASIAIAANIIYVINANKIAADINNEDSIAEETNAPEKIYNIELADGTIVSFTEEEYENFKEYLNSIKAEEEKTYKLTR